MCRLHSVLGTDCTSTGHSPCRCVRCEIKRGYIFRVFSQQLAWMHCRLRGLRSWPDCARRAGRGRLIASRARKARRGHPLLRCLKVCDALVDGSQLLLLALGVFCRLRFCGRTLFRWGHTNKRISQGSEHTQQLTVLLLQRKVHGGSHPQAISPERRITLDSASLSMRRSSDRSMSGYRALYHAKTQTFCCMQAHTWLWTHACAKRTSATEKWTGSARETPLISALR